MNKDCNNCNRHTQALNAMVPEPCWDCFDLTVAPMALRNWTPKVPALELVPMDVPVQTAMESAMARAISPAWEKDPLGANNKQVAGSHYKEMGVAPWDVVNTWPLEQQVGVYRHGVLKYTMRMGSKDKRLQEAQKALHYCEKLVEVLKKEAGPETLRGVASCRKS